jgi:hypothetical protein
MGNQNQKIIEIIAGPAQCTDCGRMRGTLFAAHNFIEHSTGRYCIDCYIAGSQIGAFLYAEQVNS